MGITPNKNTSKGTQQVRRWIGKTTGNKTNVMPEPTPLTEDEQEIALAQGRKSLRVYAPLIAKAIGNSPIKSDTALVIESVKETIERAKALLGCVKSISDDVELQEDVNTLIKSLNVVLRQAKSIDELY